MNERIKKLAEQAMVETQHEFGGKYLAFSKEKFAELIVKDCASQIDSFVAMNVPPVLLSSLLRKQYIKDESSKEL